MAKAKTSAKRGFSFDGMRELNLKKNSKVIKHNSSKIFLDPELVSQALIQSLKDGDSEAFKEILAAHLPIKMSFQKNRAFQEELSFVCSRLRAIQL